MNQTAVRRGNVGNVLYVLSAGNQRMLVRGRVAEWKEEIPAEAPYFVLPAGAQMTVKALHERNVRVLTNALASDNQLAAHLGYAKTRRRLMENGMELYELRPDTDAFRPAWSLVSNQSPAALHTNRQL